MPTQVESFYTIVHNMRLAQREHTNKRKISGKQRAVDNWLQRYDADLVKAERIGLIDFFKLGDLGGLITLTRILRNAQKAYDETKQDKAKKQAEIYAAELDRWLVSHGIANALELFPMDEGL